MGPMTPGMGGMPPGMGGMPGMGMGGMSPQQMLAAQAAAEAYQRAMMSFSQAGSVPASQAASEAGDGSPGPGAGSRMGAASPFPQMGMLSPMMTGMTGNPMYMNPMMMGGMGGMGMMGGMGGGMSPGMMPGTPGMYGQQFTHGVPTPTSEAHNTGSRFSGYNGSPDGPNNDRSAAHSQQSHRDSPPATRPSPN